MDELGDAEWRYWSAVEEFEKAGLVVRDDCGKGKARESWYHRQPWREYGFAVERDRRRAAWGRLICLFVGGKNSCGRW